MARRRFQLTRKRNFWSDFNWIAKKNVEESAWHDFHSSLLIPSLNHSVFSYAKIFIVCVSVYAVATLQGGYLAHSLVTHPDIAEKSIVTQWYCCDSTPSVASRAFRASRKVKEDEEGSEQVFALFFVPQKAHENWYIFLLSVFCLLRINFVFVQINPRPSFARILSFLFCEQSKNTKTVLFREAWDFLTFIWASLI